MSNTPTMAAGDMSSAQRTSPTATDAQPSSAVQSMRGALRGQSMAQQIQMLRPRPVAEARSGGAVQRKEGDKGAGGKAGGGRKATMKEADDAFNGWWREYGQTPETIEKARLKVVEMTGGVDAHGRFVGLPDGWVPPPLRDEAKGSSKAPGGKEDLDPTGIGALARGPSADNPAGHHGTDEGGNKACIPADTDAGGNPVTRAPPPQAAPHKSAAGGDKAATPDAEPGFTPTNEYGLPIKGPFGFSMAWDASGKAEISGKAELTKLPELTVNTAPVPIVLTLKPEVSASVKGSRDASRKVEVSFAIETSATASAGLGVSEFNVSAGFELKSSTTIKATWEPGKGWTVAPFENRLTGSPVLTAKAGPLELKRTLDEYEMVVLQIGLGSGVKVTKGKDVDRFYDDVVSILTPASNQVGPDHGTSGSTP